jgi:predicted NUDIX family NTP pyrophosphohydrolase
MPKPAGYFSASIGTGAPAICRGAFVSVVDDPQVGHRELGVEVNLAISAPSTTAPPGRPFGDRVCTQLAVRCCLEVGVERNCNPTQSKCCFRGHTSCRPVHACAPDQTMP